MGQEKDKKEIVLNRLNNVRKKIFKYGELNQDFEDEFVKIKIEVKSEIKE